VLENLKFIRSVDWMRLTRLECDSQVNPDRQGNRRVSQVAISEQADIVYFKGNGMIKVFKPAATKNDVEYWATNDLRLPELIRLKYAEMSWMIETCHRGIKQFCGIERCQARAEKAQRKHIKNSTSGFLAS